MALDTHALSSRLAGTFRPTEIHAKLGEQLQRLGEKVFERAQASGAMRRDVTSLDVGFVLEGIAQVRLGNLVRTTELRQRLLSVVIDGLRAGSTSPMSGPPPPPGRSRTLDGVGAEAEQGSADERASGDPSLAHDPQWIQEAP